MNKDNHSDPLKKYCYICEHFDENLGTCSEIHENVRSYPNKFFKKCNSKFFVKDTNRISKKIYKAKQQDIETETKHFEQSGKTKEPAEGFKPENYQFMTKFPSNEEITISCHSCKKQKAIKNPILSLNDSNFRLIDVQIFPQSGCLFKIANTIAILPAAYVYTSTENWILAIILALILLGPIYVGIRELVVRFFGGIYEVGYVTCDACEKRTYVAFNKRKAVLLRKI